MSIGTRSTSADTGVRGAHLCASVRAKGLKRRRAGEEGYVLIAVLFMVVLVLIALSIAAPKVAADLERDREIELMHRGKQYVRAIKLYYRKFNAYPPNMEALVKSNQIRFLRRRYKDPVTGKDEWHLIHCGEAKAQALGMFGQPIVSTGCAAVVVPGGAGQSLFGGNPTTSGGVANADGSTDPNAGGAQSPGNQNQGGLNQAGLNQAVLGGQAGQPGPGGTPTDPNAPNAPNGGSSSIFGGAGGGNGQTFGGGGIIGVESTSSKPTILEYKKKKHFNEWEFVYDPVAEQAMTVGNAGTIGPQGGPQGNGIGTPGSVAPGIQPGAPAVPPQSSPQPQQ